MKKIFLLGVTLTLFVCFTAFMIQRFNPKSISLSVYANEDEASGRCLPRSMADCFSASGSIWIGYTWVKDIETIQ